MTTRLCWNCETAEVEADESFCSPQCWEETMKRKNLPVPNLTYCKDCKKLFNKDLGCFGCEAKMYQVGVVEKNNG